MQCCINKNATVTVCHSKKKEIEQKKEKQTY